MGAGSLTCIVLDFCDSRQDAGALRKAGYAESGPVEPSRWPALDSLIHSSGSRAGHSDQSGIEDGMPCAFMILLLRRMDDSRFPLVSRGFRWINEWPFNR